MNNENKIIRYDSPEAAKYRTNISGWVNINNRFCGEDEHLARWSSCTHIICECGELVEKTWTMCGKCRDKKASERYNAMVEKIWDMKEYPVYSFCHDEYFFDEDELDEYLFVEGCSIEDLKLTDCEPVYFPLVRPDYFSGYILDDGELPISIQYALSDLNTVIIEHNEPAYYSPGKHRLVINED